MLYFIVSKFKGRLYFSKGPASIADTVPRTAVLPLKECLSDAVRICLS